MIGIMVIALTLGMLGTALAVWFVKDAEKYYDEAEALDRQIREAQRMLKANKLLHK